MKLTLTDRQTDRQTHVIHTLTQTTKTHAGCVCMEKQKRVKVSYNNAILYEADINRQTDRQTDRCNTHTHTIKETTRWMCVHGNDKKKQNVFYNYALLVSSRHEWTYGQTHKRTHRLTCRPPHPGTAGPLWSCWRPNDGRCSTSLTAVVSGLRAQQRSDLRNSFCPLYCVKSFSPSYIYIYPAQHPLCLTFLPSSSNTPPPPQPFFCLKQEEELGSWFSDWLKQVRDLSAEVQKKCYLSHEHWIHMHKDITNTTPQAVPLSSLNVWPRVSCWE